MMDDNLRRLLTMTIDNRNRNHLDYILSNKDNFLFKFITASFIVSSKRKLTQIENYLNRKKVKYYQICLETGGIILCVHKDCANKLLCQKNNYFIPAGKYIVIPLHTGANIFNRSGYEDYNIKEIKKCNFKEKK